MRVRIIRTCSTGGETVSPGRTIDVSKTEARDLIHLGKALPAEGDGAQVENTTAVGLDTNNSAPLVKREKPRGRRK